MIFLELVRQIIELTFKAGLLFCEVAKIEKMFMM
jgi:hypothetical protein